MAPEVSSRSALTSDTERGRTYARKAGDGRCVQAARDGPRRLDDQRAERRHPPARRRLDAAPPGHQVPHAPARAADHLPAHQRHGPGVVA
eukprot:1033008-Prymnesium_polylepis.1